MTQEALQEAAEAIGGIPVNVKQEFAKLHTQYKRMLQELEKTNYNGAKNVVDEIQKTVPCGMCKCDANEVAAKLAYVTVIRTNCDQKRAMNALDELIKRIRELITECEELSR